MPITTSLDHPVELGTECPNFSLKAVDTGKKVTRDGLVEEQGNDFKGLVVMFICNHCPVCSHIRPALAVVSEEYIEEGFAFVGIMPHELGVTPMNGPDEMKAEITQFDYKFPYCFDGDVQDASRAIGAVTTPDFFVYDSNLKLVYRGSFDATRPANQGKFTPPCGAEKLFIAEAKVGKPSDGAYLKAALDALAKGKTSGIDQHPSEGCSIKWLRGNKEPKYSKSEYDYPEALAMHLAWNKKYLMWKRIYDVLYFFLGFFGFKRPALGSELKDGGI